MSDLEKALADIGDIRQQLAAGAMFRGFGPVVMATTGGLALAVAIAQVIWPQTLATDDIVFVSVWIVTAVVATALIGLEMIARSRRHHRGLADAMLFNAAEHFLPVGATGAVVAVVTMRAAPDIAWILPGFWSLLIALGLFAGFRFLPRTVAICAAWYFVAGVAVLLYGANERMLSPPMMALPFGVGQLLLAGVLRFAYGPETGGDNVEAG